MSDIYMSVDIVKPDLSAAELSGFPTSGGDVNGAVACQGVWYALVHQPPPVEMISV